jgi:hypothetical protein
MSKSAARVSRRLKGVLGQDLYDVFRKAFVDFPMPRNRLFLACYRVHVQVVPRPGTDKNTTRFEQSLDEFLSFHTATRISLVA